jgi:fatty-acyl-CoA synthase
MAGYKTPKYVVPLDALPKNPSGKILKRSLRESYSDLSRVAAQGDPARR